MVEPEKQSNIWPSAPRAPSPAMVRVPRLTKLLVTALVCVALVILFNPLGSRISPRLPSSLSETFRASPSGPAISNTFNSSAPESHLDPLSEDAGHYWDLFSYAISRGRPGFPEVRKLKVEDPWQLYQPDEAEPRVDNLILAADEFQNLKTSLRSIKKDSGILGPKLPFRRGTRGIVVTSNNDALSILITSLRMLRQTGSTLPVEVFLDEYEQPACESILPQLGARCVFITDHLPAEMEHPLIIEHFMSKIMSILFSSFEQVLFLDMDLFPINNPDSIFLTEPFISSGFVLWPDYWASTASHYLYELLDLPLTDLTLRATTESGALLINKASHADALIVTAYLNAWGPKVWYRLLSQGATGEGDKDTWLAAIQALGLPFYQVSERPGRIGYRCDGMHRSIATVQHHPLDDWTIRQHNIDRNSRDVGLADAPAPRPLFVHGNLPKYDAPTLLKWRIDEVEWIDMLRCRDGKPHRIWGPKPLTIIKYGWDIEKALWDSMRWTACNHEYDLRMWVNGTWHSEPVTNVCKDMVTFYEQLFPNETYQPELPSVSRLERPWGGGFVI